MKLLYFHDEQNSEHDWKQKNSMNRRAGCMYVIGNIRKKLWGSGEGAGDMVGTFESIPLKRGHNTSYPILYKPNDCPTTHL